MEERYRQALAASEARFRELIEKTTDGLLVLRPDGVICYANPAAQALLGRPAAALVGTLFGTPLVRETTEVDIWPPLHGLCEAGVNGRGHAPESPRTPGVAEMRLVEIEWEGGRALLASLHDVTARKDAEHALRFLAEVGEVLAGSLGRAATLEAVARLAVAHLADWCLIDLIEPDAPAWEVWLLSRGAAQHAQPEKAERARTLCGLHSVPRAAPVGPAVVLREGRAVHYEEASEDLLAALALDGRHLDTFQALGCKSALVAPLVARGRVVGAITFIASGPGRWYGEQEQALARELADRAALALDSARLYDEAQEAVRRRDEFLAMLAHELRNPLGAILSAAELLRVGGPAAAQGWQSRAATIERQGRHLTRLLEDLLDVSRVTLGKIELQKQVVDLAAVAGDALQACQALVQGRKHRLTLELDGGPLYVEGDPTRLAQVVANLLSNAAKYTEPGGRIGLAAWAENEEVVLRVRDTGIGIPPDQLTRIFEPFAQVQSSLARVEGGLGIGLTLVKRLVEMHGGAVEARSAGPGKGSEILVRLPASKGLLANGPVGVAEGAEVQPGGSRGPKRVLLVEDNADGREMLADLLRLWGYEVEGVGSGQEGLERMRSLPPDVALIDIGLPGLDGYQVAQAVRALPGGQDILLLAVTGYGKAEDKYRARAAGFDAHLVKPVDLNRLAQLLQGGRG